MKNTLRSYLTKSSLIAALVGCSTVLALGYNLELYTFSGAFGYALPNHTVVYEGEVHVHADFQMYLNDERIRFTEDTYQSKPDHTLDISQHFHDGSDLVIHRHQKTGTLVDFFHSLGVTISDSCLILPDQIKHCTDATNELMLFVNGKRVSDLTQYATVEEDRILLYYGHPDNPRLAEYVQGISDESCLYSHTCPERGEPPTESCGLTCDVANVINRR